MSKHFLNYTLNCNYLYFGLYFLPSRHTNAKDDHMIAYLRHDVKDTTKQVSNKP